MKLITLGDTHRLADFRRSLEFVPRRDGWTRDWPIVYVT